MAREHWQDPEDQRREARPRDDLGQADYSTTYGYNPDQRQGYRRYSNDDPDYARHMDGPLDRRESPPRSFMERAGEFFSPSPPTFEDRSPNPRRGPSDRVLWAVIMERLDDERGLDLRDVRVIVEDAEVTLSGTVRHKGDKRRIEDVADIKGIRHVQNNLRVRDNGHWTFF
jgi:hypothetical protein